MQENIAISLVSIDMTPHYVDGVPWLIGRPNGEALAKNPLAESGMADVKAGQAIRMIIPEGSGVNKSFFEGFLLEYSRRTFELDSGIRLAELVSIDPLNPEQGSKHRYNQSHANLSAALVSLVDFWKHKQVIGKQLADVN